jgi:hypothetical protein
MGTPFAFCAQFPGIHRRASFAADSSKLRAAASAGGRLPAHGAADAGANGPTARTAAVARGVCRISLCTAARGDAAKGAPATAHRFAVGPLGNAPAALQVVYV